MHKQMRSLTVLVWILILLPLVAGASKAKPYTPLRYEINKVDVGGFLGLSLLKGNIEYKGQEIYGINESGWAGYKDLTQKPSVSFLYVPRGTVTEEVADHRVNLKTDTQNVVLCYSVYATKEQSCSQSISFDWKEEGRISVGSVEDWGTLLKRKGVSDQDEVRAELISFDIEGDISGEPIKISGSFLYDKSPESIADYEKSVRQSELIYSYGVLIFLLGILIAIGIAIFLILRGARRLIVKIRKR